MLNIKPISLYNIATKMQINSFPLGRSGLSFEVDNLSRLLINSTFSIHNIK